MMEEQRKPILVLDFDGVLHSYKSGWKGAEVVVDEPVEGAQEFCRAAQEHFTVVIFSSRCDQKSGIEAIVDWLFKWKFPADIQVTWRKPAAHVTLDDRAVTFTGHWPSIESLLAFVPWNKQPKIIGIAHCCEPGCDKPAEFRATFGPTPDDYTEGCGDHIWELACALVPEPNNVVISVLKL